MALKNPTLAVLALGFLLPGMVKAQTVSTTIPLTLSANLTLGDQGKIKATVNQTVTQPPTSIAFGDLSFNSQPFVFTTANASGATTVWKGSLSLSSDGKITGNANVESYTNTGVKTAASCSVNATSRITSSTNNTIIARSNMRSESYGPYSEWNDFKVLAEYAVDVLINFSNGFTIRGKIIRTYENTHNLQQASDDEDYYNSYWDDYNLIITGPNGQIGTFIK